MSTTIDDLKERITRVQEELDAVSAALDELHSHAVRGTSSTSHDVADRLAAAGVRDSREYARLGRQSLSRMGIPSTTPCVSGEEVQQLMIREGADPDDISASRAVIEAREE